MDFFGSPLSHRPLRHVLFIAEGQLGDLLLLTPALRSVKESFPGSRTAVLVLQRRRYDAEIAPQEAPGVLTAPAGGTSVVLLNDPHVDEVMEIDRSALRRLKGILRIKAEFAVVAWLRRERFDTVVCTFPQERFFQWAFLSGARIRAGEEGRNLSFLLNRRIRQTKGDKGVLRYYCALAEAVGAKTEGCKETHFVLSPGTEKWAEEELARRGISAAQHPVAVHPGASGPYRIWPPEHFCEVIARLRLRGRPVFLCGSDFDRGAIEAVRRCSSSDIPAIITAGGVSYLAALFSKSSLLLCNDSGPRHLAAAVGTPTLAVMPRFGDRAWKIYNDESRHAAVQSPDACPACGSDECRNVIPDGAEFGSSCLHAVTPDQVIRRLDLLLL